MTSFYHPPASEEQRMIAETVREFANERISPITASIDEAAAIPPDVLAELAELGLLGIPVSEEKGGAGFDSMSYVLVLMELASVSPAVALHIANQTFALETYLAVAPPSEISEGIVSGEAPAALAFHEKGGLTRLASTKLAVDGEALRGTKTLVIGGAEARNFLVTARCGDEFALASVPSTADGVSKGPSRKRTGMRGLSVCDVHFDGTPLGDGTVFALDETTFSHAVHRGMVAMTAVAAGLMRSASIFAANYAREREQFGRPIARFEAIRARLALIESESVVAENLAATAARMLDDGVDVAQFARVAKLHSSRGSMRAADAALQVYGGYGYSSEYPVERIYRDARYLSVALGGNDALRLTIADFMES